jgi:hypothetical protein
MKNHLFVNQVTGSEERALKSGYAHVVPVLRATNSSLFFCSPIGFDILSPSLEAAEQVKRAFGWQTIREIEPGRFTTDDDIW